MPTLQQPNAALKMSVPIERQIGCVARELAMRKRVYPAWIRGGRLKQVKADDEIAAMEAVLDTLLRVQAGGEDVAQEPAGE